MNTETQPNSTLATEQDNMETLRQSIAAEQIALFEMENQRDHNALRVVELKPAIEEAEIVAFLDAKEKPTLEKLRSEHASAQEAVSRLTIECRARRRMLEGRRRDLERQEALAAGRKREIVLRQTLDLMVPIVSAMATFLLGFRDLKWGASEIQSWVAAWGNRSTAARFAAASLGEIVTAAVSGNSDFMPTLIRELKTAAPDRVTPAMESYLSEAEAMMARRLNTSAPKVSAQEVSRAHFEDFQRQEDARYKALFGTGESKQK